MLVLTRKLDEAIRIGEDIKITVIRVKGNTVRLGIEAPRDVRVVRDELDKHNTSAKASSDSPAAAVAAVGAAASPAASANGLATAAPTVELDLGDRCQLPGGDDGAVIATVVDSPQPSGTRLFVGKVKLGKPIAPLVEQEMGDQAAPLRAFLRGGRKLQAAG